MIKEVEMNTIHLKVFAAKDQSDVDIFWGLFNSYINELSLHVSMGDDFDLDYFYSDEYREIIEELRTRDINPLNLFLIHKDGTVLGFLMYVTYFDEGGKCFLMEYYIEPTYRNLGYGEFAYSMVEKHVYADGAKYIELTPTNDANERFWRSVGYMKSSDMDEDHKYIYRKSLCI
jgi:GNAT superfamily N-acetyltransferase